MGHSGALLFEGKFPGDFDMRGGGFIAVVVVSSFDNYSGGAGVYILLLKWRFSVVACL